MKVKPGDKVFTPYQGTEYIVPNQMYPITKVYGPIGCQIMHPEYGSLYILVNTPDFNCAHLDSKGHWYKLECSIQQRHNA